MILSKYATYLQYIPTTCPNFNGNLIVSTGFNGWTLRFPLFFYNQKHTWRRGRPSLWSWQQFDGFEAETARWEHLQVLGALWNKTRSGWTRNGIWSPSQVSHSSGCWNHGGHIVPRYCHSCWFILTGRWSGKSKFARLSVSQQGFLSEVFLGRLVEILWDINSFYVPPHLYLYTQPSTTTWHMKLETWIPKNINCIWRWRCCIYII